MLNLTVLRRFLRETRGLAAVEFAMLAPMMLLILMASIELPRAFSLSQKLSRASRVMADLIARDNLASLDDVYAAGLTVTEPFDTDSAVIKLAAVGVYSGASARVCSSAGRNGSSRTVNSSLGQALPAFAATGSRYVLAEVTGTYTPIFDALPGLKNLSMTRTTAWPVRKGNTANGDPEVVLPGGKVCPAS